MVSNDRWKFFTKTLPYWSNFPAALWQTSASSDMAKGSKQGGWPLSVVTGSSTKAQARPQRGSLLGKGQNPITRSRHHLEPKWPRSNVYVYISAGPPLGGATRLRRSCYSQTIKQLPFLVLLSTFHSVVSLTVVSCWSYFHLSDN